MSGGIDPIKAIAAIATIGTVGTLLVVVRAGRITVEEAKRGNVDILGDFILVWVAAAVVIAFGAVMWGLLTDF